MSKSGAAPSDSFFRTELSVARGELVLVVALLAPARAPAAADAAIELPSSGRITIAGRTRAIDARARATCADGSASCSGAVLFEDRSVLDNVSAPPDRRRAQAEAIDRARVALQRVGLDAARLVALRCDRWPGERRRVCWRALANRPALLLIDEPGGSAADPGTDAPRFRDSEQFCSAGSPRVATRAPQALPSEPAARRITLLEGRLQS